MQWATEWASRQSRRWLVEAQRSVWYGRLYEATVGASQRHDECVGASQRHDECSELPFDETERPLKARTQSHPNSMGCPRTTSGAQVFEGVASDLNSKCVCLNTRKKSVQSNDEDGKGSGGAWVK